jgi:hypothetical protein
MKRLSVFVAHDNDGDEKGLAEMVERDANRKFPVDRKAKPQLRLRACGEIGPIILA